MGRTGRCTGATLHGLGTRLATAGKAWRALHPFHSLCKDKYCASANASSLSVAPPFCTDILLAKCVSAHPHEHTTITTAGAGTVVLVVDAAATTSESRWSSDGVVWQRASATVPVVPGGTPTDPAWETRTVYQPFLVSHNDTLYDFYNAAGTNEFGRGAEETVALIASHPP
jgi:hypothetical protein